MQTAMGGHFAVNFARIPRSSSTTRTMPYKMQIPLGTCTSSAWKRILSRCDKHERRKRLSYVGHSITRHFPKFLFSSENAARLHASEKESTRYQLCKLSHTEWGDIKTLLPILRHAVLHYTLHARSELCKKKRKKKCT